MVSGPLRPRVIAFSGQAATPRPQARQALGFTTWNCLHLWTKYLNVPWMCKLVRCGGIITVISKTPIMHTSTQRLFSTQWLGLSDSTTRAVAALWQVVRDGAGKPLYE